jgi:hypothetical protein
MLQCSSFATELSMPDVGASTGEMKHFFNNQTPMTEEASMPAFLSKHRTPTAG